MGVHTRSQKLVDGLRGKPTCELSSVQPAGPAPAQDSVMQTPHVASTCHVMTRKRKRGLAPAESSVVQTPHVAGTNHMMTRKRKRGGCGALPCRWDALCPDLQRLVLSKVPQRDLASAGATCRGIREDFRRRLEEEQERLIAIAEENYGKDALSGFVKSVQKSICGLVPYHAKRTKKRQALLINAAGGLERVTNDVFFRRLRTGSLAFLDRRSPSWRAHQLETSTSTKCQVVVIHVREFGNAGMQIDANVRGDEAGLGVFLAICTRKPEPMLSCWEASSRRVPLIIRGTSNEDTKFKGSLWSLANTFFLFGL